MFPLPPESTSTAVPAALPRRRARPTAARRSGRSTTAPAAAAPPGDAATHRARILEAAAEEFSRRGFHGTSARHVATKAKVSLGNIYNHFKSMRALFDTLLEEEERLYFAPDTPMQRLFADFRFPEDLEKLGAATGESVRRFARYLRLIYVDVTEFQGEHIARLFRDMRVRYEKAFGPALRARQAKGELGAVDPVTSLMGATLLFFNYFTAEELFGGARHYGCSHERAIAELSRLIRFGVLPRD
ncbi:MAG: TetR/AcrR family transcriptional regulator [Planctomycetes bacterium]|nr:TetR/AcrR family transcriptional regulator [Planctomycetota bacterium]